MRLPLTVTLLMCLGIFACSDPANGQKGEFLATQLDSISYGIGTDIGSNMMRSGIDSLEAVPFENGLTDALAELLTDEKRELGLKNMKDSMSYQIGARLGLDFQRGGLDTLNVKAVAKGTMDAMYKREDSLTAATRTQAGQFMLDAQKKAMAMQREEQAKQFEQNKAAGDAWLAENGTKPGVITTESGLQYKIVKKGTGKKPTAADRVEVDYKGTLIDGTEFDSSYKRGKHAEFGVGQVISGWTEGLQLMKEGATYEFYIPSDLAYGPSRGPGGSLPPHSALIFEVVLYTVNP